MKKTDLDLVSSLEVITLIKHTPLLFWTVGLSLLFRLRNPTDRSLITV